MCVEDIKEESKSSDGNLDLCFQLGAVLVMPGYCWCEPSFLAASPFVRFHFGKLRNKLLGAKWGNVGL